MRHFAGVAARALGCALALLMAGCAAVVPTEPVTPARAPAVEAGPLIELLSMETTRDRVRAIADADGRARVFIASAGLRQVVEVIVGADGVAERRVVRSGAAPASIDAAFDAQGRLHLLLDTEHLLFEDGAWQGAARTPWQEAGVPAQAARFVAGAPDLVWAFQVSGKAFGAPARMEVYGFGGHGVGIAWPWFTTGSRAVLVQETPAGYGPWVVLEPQGRASTFPTALASDRHGNVQLVYERSHGGLGAESSYHYARIDAAVLGGDAVGMPGVTEARLGARRFLAVEGRDERIEAQAGDLGRQLTVDPDSGTALVGLRYLVRGASWSPAPGWSPGHAFRVDVAPGGHDAFHALAVGEARDPWWGRGTPIQYLMFSQTEWSAPVELGLADVASFWGHVWDAVGIAGAGGGSALLVWPMKHGIVGRWVRRAE